MAHWRTSLLISLFSLSFWVNWTDLKKKEANMLQYLFVETSPSNVCCSGKRVGRWKHLCSQCGCDDQASITHWSIFFAVLQLPQRSCAPSVDATVASWAKLQYHTGRFSLDRTHFPKESHSPPQIRHFVREYCQQPLFWHLVSVDTSGRVWWSVNGTLAEYSLA